MVVMRFLTSLGPGRVDLRYDHVFNGFGYQLDDASQIITIGKMLGNHHVNRLRTAGEKRAPIENCLFFRDPGLSEDSVVDRRNTLPRLLGDDGTQKHLNPQIRATYWSIYLPKTG